MTEAEKAYQYFVIAVPESEEQAKAYFWARKALRITLTPPNEWVSVEERLPEESDGMVLLTDGISVRTGYRNWMFRMDDYPIVFVPGQKKGGGEMAVTHWMKISAPPNRRPPEGEANA